MRNVSGIFVLFACGALLSGCGGGGGGGSTPSVVIPTSINGTVTPLVSPAAVTTAPSANMLIPTNSASLAYATIQQNASYIVDTTVLPVIKISSSILQQVRPAEFTSLSTGATAYSGDPTLGQLNQITTTGTTVSTALTLYSTSTSSGLQVATYKSTTVAGFALAYAMPYSAAINPNGYTYQTFGAWVNAYAGTIGESYFSTGIPTAPATLPTVGTASYTGLSTASYINAATRDYADASATMNATVDFGARTVAFATTGTTVLSVNAVAGSPRTANAALDMSGTLSYAAGSNTFSGAVSTGNGMTGNATGRFYGPGIATATASKVAGSPTEIGGTFAVMKSGVGSMQGAFGGN